MAYDLKAINPRLLDFQFDLAGEDPGYETIVEQLDETYHLQKDHLDEKVLHEIYGLTYDRDSFVFYGDPAFLTKLDDFYDEPLLTTTFLRTGENTHQFIIEYKDVETAQQDRRPIGNVFTSRIAKYNIINGFEYEPILADNFISIRKTKPRDAQSKTITIDFRGTIIS